MLKVLGSLAVFAASFLIGNMIYSSYGLRLKQLEEYGRFISELIITLEYRPQSITQLLTFSAKKLSPPLSNVLDKISKRAANGQLLGKIWEEEFINSKNKFALSDEELEMLASTGNIFSEIQREKIINGLKMVLLTVETHIQQALDDKKNKGEVRRKLAVLGGVALIIIII